MPEFEAGDIIEFTDRLKIDDEDVKHGLDFLNHNNPRKYRVVSKAGDGGKGLGYQCELLNQAGNGVIDRNGESLQFFVKIPKEGGEYDHHERMRYMNIMKEAAIGEKLTWAKLRSIQHRANVAFDRCVADYENVPFPKTAQRFLSHGQTLKEKINYESSMFQPIDEKTFLHYALMLAELIETVHNRRVTHGDIHPGNIFVTSKQEAWRSDSLDVDEHFVLIDFGAAIFEQGHDGAVNLNHEFRAPERDPKRASYVISEAVDTYSFGKILYVLGTGLSGELAKIPDGFEDDRKRRAYIREKLQAPYSQNPCYLDIIAACCSYDPINRPSMSQAVARLKALINGGLFASNPSVRTSESLNTRIMQMKTQSEEWVSGLDSVTKDLFEMMVREKVEEMMSMFSDIPTTQAIVRGTRWDVINSITMLFDHMKAGDSWTCFTTPEVWQGNGLGLGGRYMSSNVLALRRGASIRRFMGVSVDQLGKDWSRGLAEILDSSRSTHFRSLSKRLSQAADNTTDKYDRSIGDDYRKKYRKMLYDYLCAWRDAISKYNLSSVVADDLFLKDHGKASASYLTANGLHMSMLVYEDINGLRESRKANAPSLLILGDARFNVLTEMRGRLPRKSGQEREKEPAIPSLVGFRLFKSLQPDMIQQRMIRFYDLVHRPRDFEWRQAVNIGPSLAELCEAVESKLEL